MEIESVFIDEWGKFGVISKDKRQYWIKLSLSHATFLLYNNIECEGNKVVLKRKDNRNKVILSTMTECFRPSWKSGHVLQEGMSSIELFYYKGNSVIIGKNGDCYETESDCTYAFVDKGLYKINLHTGQRLSDKIAPSFTQSIVTGRNIQTVSIDHYEMNSLGLLQIYTDTRTFYDEMDIGEIVERVSKNIIVSIQNIRYIQVQYEGTELVQRTIQRINAVSAFNVLKTFYDHYKYDDLHGSGIKINGATVIKYSDRIEVTGLNSGRKLKPRRAS